jgi:hypothetical protein
LATTVMMLVVDAGFYCVIGDAGEGNNIVTVLALLEQSLASPWKEVGKRLCLTTSRNDRRAMTNNYLGINDFVAKSSLKGYSYNNSGFPVP